MALEPQATVRDWIASRTSHLLAPATLIRQMLAHLGANADAPAARTAELCLAAAARALDGILLEQKFGRRHALELLAVDALTTVAFEHASKNVAAGLDSDLSALATRGASMLGQLSAQRV